MSTVTTSACRIERVVNKWGKITAASFVVLKPQKTRMPWTACVAKLWADGEAQIAQIVCMNRFMTPEQAAALSTALQMAVEWITEETARQKL